MDFFDMKRKKLQGYCKKHGIPANLKNVEMAERLSLLYQGEKNENPAPPRLQAGKGGLNVEVIDLDSDSGADDVEALDTVAGNDSNQKTNSSDEHKLDEETDQFLTTSPESEVKSDKKVDSDTIAGNESNEKTNLSDEHKLDEETDQFLTTPESEVKSDHKVDSDTVAGNESIEKTNLSDEHKLDEETDQFLTTYPESEVKSDHKVDSDAFEVESASLQKTSQGREGSNMNLAPEVDDDIGSSYEEETMQMSINTGNIEDNHHASRGEDDKMMEREVEINRASVKADVLEDTSGTEVVEDEPEILDPINIHKEPITENVNPLQVSPNESNVCLIEPVQKLDDNDCVMDETAAMCLDASTGSAVGNADACEVKSASSQKTSRGREESNMKLAPEGDDTGFSYEEETMQMSVNTGKIEDNQELHASPSVDGNMESEVEIKTSGTADVLEDTSGTEKVEDEPETVEDELESIMENVSPKDSGCLVEPVQKMDDNDCVMDETAAMCLDASKVAKNTDENSNAMVEDIVDEVHSTSFVISDGTPVQVLHNDPSNEVETSDLDVHEMVATGSAVGNADACELKSASSHKTSRGREESNMNLAPEGDDVGSSYEKETMQMSVNMGKIEDNQELHHALPSDDENMMEREIHIKIMSGKIDVLEDTCGTKIVEDENEKLDQINIHQESIMENVNSLHVSPKQSIGCLVEPVQKLDDHDCDMDETAAMCLDAKNTDENSHAIIEDIPDEVHSSSFEDSDGTPVQVLPTDPSNEVDASDLDVHEMDATGTAAKTADKSAVKFDSSQKLNITPASDKMIDTSTELKNNSVSPRDIGVCGMEENMQIGEIEDQVDQSQEKLMDLSPNRLNNPKTPTNADIGICDLEADLQIGSNKENIDLSEKPSAVDTSHDEDLTEVVSEELHNDLTEGEDANMDYKIDLQDVCETGDSREEAVNHLNVHNLVVTGTASENAATSVVTVVSEELANNLMEEEVEDVGDKFDLPEDVPETGNGSDEPINQGSIDTPHGSNSNNADLLHVSLVESSSPLVGGQVQKSDDNDMPGGDYDLGNFGFAVDVFCSNDNSIAAEDTDEKTVVSMENHPYEGHSPSGKCLDDEDLQLAASVEFGKKLAEVEFDLLEDVCVTAKSKDETLKSSSINCPQGSTVNGFLGEFSSYFDGEIQKSDDKIMHRGSGKSESGDYTFCFPDEFIAAKDTDAKNNVSMHKIPYEGTASSAQYSDGTQDLFMTTGELISSSGLNIFPMTKLDACEEEMLRSSEKTCMVADPEECFGFSPNELDASATKVFEAGTCFDPTTLGDVVMETCNNVNESMQIDMAEKESSQGEGRNFFENSDVNDDIGGVGAEDGNQSTEMASRKRKRSDAISDEPEKEEVKEDELVPTVPQTSEMDSSNFSLQQPFASDTASGDDDAYQKLLDSPSKATPMIHKENIKFDKKEEVRSTMSRNKFAKRQPLQDLK